MRRLISTDSHIVVPWSIADTLPDKFRAMLPHVEHRADGDYLVTPAPPGRMGARMQAAGQTEVAIDLDGPQIDRIAQMNCCAEALDPSSLPERRLAEMRR